MRPRTLSGILWNLLILWLIISKSISLFFDLDGHVFMILKILSNVLIISIGFMLFRGPSVLELEMSIGKEIADKLKIMTYIAFMILFINIFVGMSTIFSWSVQMILYSVMLILYVVFTALQILIHFKYKDL